MTRVDDYFSHILITPLDENNTLLASTYTDANTKFISPGSWIGSMAVEKGFRDTHYKVKDMTVSDKFRGFLTERLLDFVDLDENDDSK